jgi:beta-galactosidase
VAHGADAVVYFRWRTCRFGIEQYWHGILDHHGQPGRRYREVARVGKELGALGDRITGAAYAAPAGILLDPESRWALDIQKGSPKFSMLDHANRWHAALHRRHVGVEYWHPADDWTAAKLLIAPTLFLCDDALARRLAEYVTNGGTLVLTFRSGVKDAANVVTTDRLPGPLKGLAGAIVEEYDAHAGDERRALDLLPPLPKMPAKARAEAEVWCDQLRLQGAKAVARYADGPFKGSPAASVHAVGKGQAWLIGFQATPPFYDHLVKHLAARTGLASRFAPSDDVEITERVKGKERFTFVLNHAGTKQAVAMPAGMTYRDLLTGQKAGRTLTLEPYGVRVLAPVPA